MSGTGNLSGANATITFGGQYPYTPQDFGMSGYRYNFDVSFNLVAQAVDSSFNIFAVNNNGALIGNVGSFQNVDVPLGTTTGSTFVGATAAGGSSATAPTNIHYIYGVFTSAAGGTYTTPNLYLVNPPAPPSGSPSISSYSPHATVYDSGTILVTGTNLNQTNAQVDFSGTNIPITLATNNNSFTFTFPSQAAGTVVNMKYTYTGGSPITIGTLTYFADPSINGSSPSVGPTSGGTLFTITGTNLTQVGTTQTVQFGNTLITSFTTQNATTLSFPTPPQSVGAKSIIYYSYAGTTLLKTISLATIFTYQATNFVNSPVAITAYNITGTDDTNFTFDISYSLTPSIVQDCSFQLFDLSGNSAIGAQTFVPNGTTKNSARIPYTTISIPSSTIYGRFSNASGFVNTASIKLLAPFTYPTTTPVSMDVFVVPPLQIAGDNKQTVINRTSLLQSILASVQGNNFASINAYISTNLFPFTSDELTKLSFNGITKIRTIVAPSNNGGATSAIPVASGNGTATFNLSTLSPNEGLYIEFFNCGDSITLTSTTGGSLITLGGTSGTLPGLYGSNTYVYVNENGGSATATDGDLIQIFGYNIVLGGALGTPAESTETICFHKGTHILTPEGYKPVESLQAGDMVTTTKNIKASIPIKDMVKFIGKKEDGALYCLPKDSLKKGKPLNDLYMSADHAYKHNGIWKHMKCASPTEFPHSRTKKYTRETDEEDIEYYHIVIEDYFAHTIVAEGVEVETCFKDKEDGIMMVWSCDEKACTPLKCEKKKEKVEEKKAIVNKRSMFSPYVRAEEPKPIVKPLLNIVKGGSEKKKKNMTIWAYNKELNKNMPLDCNEITLPM
jgi:hypothetical protein